MLDFDLAALYQVTTGNLNKAVKRNIDRFPERFMFQLTSEEFLKFQNGISSWGGSRVSPFAFTEMGIAMLSAILRSDIAVQVSIDIMDAFVAMRQYLLSSATMSAELAEIRAKLQLLERGNEDTLEAVNDLSEDIENIYLAIGELSIKPPPAARRPMGYKFDVVDK